MARTRMTSAQTRKLILLLVMVAILAVVAALFVNWQASRNLGIDLTNLGASANSNDLPVPQFLYSFAGPAADPLQQPVGVTVDGDRVFVTDAAKSQVYEFKLDGSFVRTFGKGAVKIPLYVAVNPRTGDLWVTDRATQSIHIFDTTGKYKGEFDPKLPKDQWPTQKAAVPSKYHWSPIALAFAPDGTLYATDIQKGHRVLIFKPDGAFFKSVGDLGVITSNTQGQLIFQFPNSIKVIGNEVWVADSNNRRIQVLSKDGKFLRFVDTKGLPRGLTAFDIKASKDASTTGHVAVVDTLAHDVTIWGVDGAKIVSFGQQGVLDGQFNYPNDVSVDAKDRIFVADSSNSRIQVFGWPNRINPIPTPQTPWQWALCLSPLLLLPLLLLLRRKKFYATPDFIQTMMAAGDLPLMPARRRRWIVTPETHDMFAGIELQGVQLSELLQAVPYSESEARAIQERWETTWPQAVDLAMAKNSKVFCTENVELRRLGRTLEIETVDRVEFIRKYAKDKVPGSGNGPAAPTGSQPPVS